MSSGRPAVEPADPLLLAEAAHRLVQADARQAAAAATRAHRLAKASGDPEARVAALHALGFAQRELADPAAPRTLRAAIRIGERHGLVERTALVRRLLAGCLAHRGAIGPALRELDAACAALSGLELARTEVSRIGVLGLAGRAPATPAASDSALETLRREGDVIWEARLLKNRGLQLAERGETLAAGPDLRRARDLYASVGASEAASSAEFELARLELTSGDLPACLARLDAIDPTRLAAVQRAGLELLRAQALAAAQLTAEALAALEQAQATWTRAGIEDPEGRLEVVRLTLLSGDPAAAHRLAQRAQRSFAARRQEVYAARAAGLALAAATASGAVTRAHLRGGRRAALTLARSGWLTEARRVRLSVARAAIDLGSEALARQELQSCSALHRHGPVADRIEARHVEALIRLAGDDRRGALQAARAGLRLLESHRSALGALELRATVSRIGVELAQLGLRIALEGDNDSSLLEWAERLRACALRSTPVTAPDVPELRDRMAELRRVSAKLQRAERTGGSPRALAARQASLEASIRRLSRHAAAVADAADALPSRGETGRALGDRALVELIELDGSLVALTFVASRLTRHSLGLSAAAREQVDWLHFALARLAVHGPSGSRRATLLEGARASALALSRQLVAPLLDTIGDRALVIVPPGSLHAVPWSMLPDLRGRPTIVAPSAAAWLARRETQPDRRGKVVLVSGPRVRHARAEVAAIGELYGRTSTLGGSQATVEAVMRALEGAAVAHLACHGRFRVDSPLFSSIELADGPLNVYELQRLRRAPRLIVLSACELAASQAHPGDELLGFAAALLGMGTETVIASVAPVSDAATKRMMAAFHGHLTAGCPPAVALANAQVALGRRASAPAGFVCLGGG